MSTNSRIFPRYETDNMKIQFHAPTLEDKDITVKNVSLGGIKLLANTPLKFEPSFEVQLKLGSQVFNLTAFTVWKKIDPTDEKDNYFYGLRLVFSEEDNYRRWLTFMKALHQHQKNQAKANS